MWRILQNVLTRISPARLLLTVFAVTILVGALLLMLPIAAADGVRISALDALFTATSAVCVTGLIVVDTGSAYSLFGQWVILALIQAGGLGIMTFASIGFKLFGAKLPITHQQALEDCLFQRSAAKEFSYTFPRILKIVVFIEFCGFLLILAGTLGKMPLGNAIYSAFFHSISAFCNAGFSIYADSLTRFSHNPVVMMAVSMLIIFGGLGHIVLRELQMGAGQLLRWRHAGPAFRFSFHSRVVLITAAVLIAGGAVALLASGVRDGGWAGSLMAVFFQSVTARTAGFNTVDIANVPLAALLVLIILMFIGGAPGSCAGGIKTTSFAVYMARIRAAMHGSMNVSLFGREIPRDLVLRAVAVIGMATVWNTVGVIILAAALPVGTPLKDILFEQVSAFGTVGLSTGTTALLGRVGRLWIIATMFIGRLGPLTLLLSFVATNKPRVRYAEGRIMVG